MFDCDGLDLVHSGVDNVTVLVAQGFLPPALDDAADNVVGVGEVSGDGVREAVAPVEVQLEGDLGGIGEATGYAGEPSEGRECVVERVDGSRVLDGGEVDALLDGVEAVLWRVHDRRRSRQP